MAQVSNDQVVNLFKKVYGELSNLLPQDYILGKDIPFSEGQKVGDAFIEAFILSNETGWTLAGEGQDAFDINPAVAGVVKQSSIKPSQVVLSSVIPFAFISRGAGGGEKSFYDSTKHVMNNHMKSHGRLLEAMRHYGQADKLLGYVTFALSGTVYRGATYSGDGDVTLTKADGTTIAFTNGINAASKAILMAPGSFAAGLWVGLEGAAIVVVDSARAVALDTTLVGVDADLGILYVKDTPAFTVTAAIGSGSFRVAYKGQEDAKEMVGMAKIMSNTGTLFGISASQYSLWKANQFNLNGKRFSLKALQKGVAQAVNAGGLDKPLKVLVNPRTFSEMVQDEAALRKYDASYKSASATNGFEAIEYYAANGRNQIVPNRFVQEGDIFAVTMEDWTRSGSAEISFKIPGMDREVIFPLENQAGWMFRSFSDQYLMCRRPAYQIYFYGANDEGTAY